MIFTFLFFFILMSVLFFVVSSMAKLKYRWYAVVANIVFYGVVYYFVVTLSGLPRPLEYHIPGISLPWNKNTVSTVEAFYVSAGKAYLTVKNGPEVRLYEVLDTPEFEAEFDKAFNEAERSGGKVIISGAGGIGEAHFSDGNFEASHMPEKEVDQNGVEVRSIK